MVEPSAPTPLETAAFVLLGRPSGRWRSDAGTRQSVFAFSIRPAQGHAALGARHLDRKVTRDNVSWNIPPLHPCHASRPCTCHRLAVARKVVCISKVARDASSVARDPRRAWRPTDYPHALKHGRIRGIPPFAARSRCRCCAIYELSKQKRRQRNVRETCT